MPIRRNGLTLIEVLIIVVMIGILLTIVIQKIGGKPDRELISELHTDVRNALAAESKFFATHNSYGTVAQLDSARLFAPIPGTSVVITVTPTGYVAVSSKEKATLQCTLTVEGGEAAAVKAEPVCQ